MENTISLGSAFSTKTGFVGKIDTAPNHGPVGTSVQLSGKGFPANKELLIVWETYSLAWKLEKMDGVEWNEFLGFHETAQHNVLCSVDTSPAGSFNQEIDIPDDYGGYHDIYVVDPATKERLNKTGFRTDASAEIDASKGVLGSPITITVQGLNPAHPCEGWYQLCYDNKPVGYLTAVTTRGTAVAEIPATGFVGTHLITIEKASFGEPFLGVETTPFFYTKIFHFLFELLDGEPILPTPIQEQIQEEVVASPLMSDGGQPKIRTDLAAFPTGLAFKVCGADFPSHCEVSLLWHDIHGDRVTVQTDGSFGTEFHEQEVPLGKAIANEKGAFELKLVHGGTQGGPHAVVAKVAGDEVARTYVQVTRRPHAIKPKAGPVGEKILIEVEGVGWTEYENIVAVNYDNAYIGYKCGNDMMGRAMIQFRGAGQGGYHFIDLYPAVYRNQNFSDTMEMPFIYQKPLLTWKDHPRGFRARYVFYIDNENGG